MTSWSFTLYKYIAWVLLLCFMAPVHALDPYEWTLDVNTASKHQIKTYDRGKKYNENNDGFGFTYGYTDSLDLKVGYFENSYNNTSVYAGFVVNKDFYIHDKFVISPGLGVLFTSGYDDTPLQMPFITPVLHPSLSIGFNTLRSTIGFIPSNNNVITFQTQIQF